MGAEGFHGRVRDGIGCLAPRYGHQAGEAPLSDVRVRGEKCLEPRGAGRCTRAVVRRGVYPRWDQADRAISTGQLRGLLPFHLRPIDVVVYHGS